MVKSVKSFFKVDLDYEHFTFGHLALQMYSKAHAKQSWIVRPFMKPYWLSWIVRVITDWSLLARSFVTNLRQVFVKEIGLKSLTVSGDCVLGINVMKESLILSSDNFPVWNLLHKVMKSYFTMGQHFLRNISLKPSGLGALSVFICFTRSSISSEVKGSTP